MLFNITLQRACILTVAILCPLLSVAQQLPIRTDDHGNLVYDADERGNRIPDFSACGYATGSRSIPAVEARAYVTPAPGDDGRRIQAAIDQVSKLPIDGGGFRGAVVLGPGDYQVAADLRLLKSGVVLRGSGAARGGATIVATGEDRRPLIRIGEQQARGSDDSVGEAVPVVDPYVPVGACRLRIKSGHGFKVGDRVLVVRPSTDAWIASLGARAAGVGWRPGRCNILWDRIVSNVDGDVVVIDAPITTALEDRYGGGTIQRYTPNRRVANVGVEDVNLRSYFDASKPLDEEHSWFGIVANHAENAWVRRVRFEHFAGGAVLLRESTKCVTVEDCLSLAPVSELGGYRRHSFMTYGGLTLFLRCFAEQGNHDFGLGHCAPGPNAFVNCYAAHARGASGPLESWASGVLFDNVRIDGNDLRLENRWGQPLGTGWSAANCVVWQCQAAVIRASNPPDAANWVIGYWAEPFGDANFLGQSDFVKPISLYQAQVAERLGAPRAAEVGPLLLDPIESTNPTLEQAAAFVEKLERSNDTLRDLIERRIAAAQSELANESAADLLPIARPKDDVLAAAHKVKTVNGWLVVDGHVLTGGRIDPSWWRGTIRPYDSEVFGPSITKFAPGRYGPNLTDELQSAIQQMSVQRQVAYDHHYGLWYDRRRDDHLMVRRADGAVTPPFFEQPFARTGKETAWDGLSKYDLTRFNPWYWRRLSDFAKLCDQRGMLFIHQNYFQHNILEAGAHWADCPWRPANNVNLTGLPEPPPYVGDKRIFIAHQFYDISDSRRRVLHEGYIRQCLDAFHGRLNVMQSIGAEYTGPLEFSRFWLDVVRRWESETDNDAMVALSTTRDVQDELLKIAECRDAVDVIDIRYWCYDRKGQLYAPAGGVSLAPRQHLRQLKPEPADTASIARAVREYRIRYPEKAVTYFAGMYCRSDNDGWATLMGGGSLANVPKLPEGLTRNIVMMQPVEPRKSNLLELASPDGHRLLYTLDEAQPFVLDFPIDSMNTPEYRLTWIDPSDGSTQTELRRLEGRVDVGAKQRVLWLSRKED